MAAPTPDITAILAALASQQSTSTPAPGTAPGATPMQPPPMQAPLPAGYPGVVSAATPSNPLAGLALPQPSNSGSLDLSSIKPVSSGNVSLADAIAKARTSSGGGGRNDRYNGRRSRSRSPRRDDPYNSNPFRDERRNDNRRRSPGRGTPASPGGNFPGYIGRSYAPGMPTSEMLDERTEVITVESSSVGLIIGRAGENLKRVEGDSGARVQFMTQTEGPYRKCKITGDPSQRAAAIQDIYKTALENPKRNTNPAPAHYNNNNSDNDPPLREGERSLQIMVPDKTVGLIIGRRGETIQDLQERSGCHINILGENKSINGLRPVNLIGTREASDKAQVLIAEVVESDTRSGQQGGGGSAPPLMHSAYGAPPQMSYDPYAPQQIPHYGRPGPDPNDKISETIYIPSEAVGMVIGKGGETIKDMQTTHSCKINVSQPSGSDIQREIGLIGSRPAIEGAKRAIWEKVNTVREKQGGLRADSMPQQQHQHAHDPYAQHRPQQPAYGYPPQAAMPPVHAAPPPMPEAADPYAAYGGYANYVALWQQSQGAYQQPPQ